jgi:hypothetical protein
MQSSGVLGSWWNLSESFAPDANYKPDRAWGELWIKPAVTSDFTLNSATTLYSGPPYVGSGNIGYDVFEQGNRGLYAVEDAYFGSRIGSSPEDLQLDVLTVASSTKSVRGTPISVGAMNGFERGATTSFARRAWEEAGLVKPQREVAFAGRLLPETERVAIG